MQPELIVYGGAYDPPHQGHLDCIQCAQQRFPDAEIWMIPGMQPAGAAGSHKQPSASFEHRMAMCKTAIERAGLQNVFVSDIESQLPAPNYTLQTLQTLREQYPEKTLAILMGQDQLRVFHKWHEPIQILRLASLVVVRRDSSERGYGGSVVEALNEQAQQLYLHLDWGPGARQAAIAEIPNSSFYIIDQQVSLAESTKIREMKHQASQLPAGWLPDPVAKYIEQHELYR